MTVAIANRRQQFGLRQETTHLTDAGQEPPEPSTAARSAPKAPAACATVAANAASAEGADETTARRSVSSRTDRHAPDSIERYSTQPGVR